MNFTYYYYCDCDYHYNQAVHVLENQKIYQYFHCSNLEAHKSQEVFMLKCQLCWQKETIEDTVSFTEERVCQHCGIQGKVGMDDEQQFMLLHDFSLDVPCQKCKRTQWVEASDYTSCPYCKQKIKVKMSNYWTD